jgi:hypothetical protein
MRCSELVFCATRDWDIRWSVKHPARRYDLGTCSLDLESLLTFDYETNS